MAAAIVGMACRFPGARGLREYWRLLVEGRFAVGEIPPERWDVEEHYDPDPSTPYKMVTRFGGFLPDIDCFDADFFRISPREAERMDPQHRLLLEVTWEALEDAGLTREQLAGSKTGVWVGLSSYDYGRAQAVGAGDAFAGYCSAFSIAANRLSYFFDWRGPSMTLDTACSSSLVAAHLAAQSLRSGECDFAIVAGANLVLLPDLNVSFSKAGMMAPDGRCKAFAASANGYVRSEGVGAVVLRRAAQANSDRVYAVIAGSAVNQDGRSNGLTAPNPAAQNACLRAAYGNADVNPRDVAYVEAHGTGTPLGDPIEAKALASVLSPERDATSPLLVGSVKTNIGHLEAAAGVAGLMKAALALHHGTVPPSLHFDAPNPHIDFEALKLRVPTTAEPWPSAGLAAGVSSFGYGGTNAHLVLQKAPVVAGVEPDPRDQLLVLSAGTRAGLERLAAATRERLTEEPADFRPLCATSLTRRSAHPERVAIVAHDASEARELLDVAPGSELFHSMRRAARGRKRVAFVFGGSGGHWSEMGSDLFETEPVARAMLEQCDQILARHGFSLVTRLRSGTLGDVTRQAELQAAVCSLQIALVAWWQSVGIQPAVVLGHSAGEVSTAYASGALDLESTLQVAWRRGACLDGAPAGAMLAVALNEQQVRALADNTDGVVVAAYNSPSSHVLSGAVDAITNIETELRARGVKCRPLGVPFASHGPGVAEAAAALAAELGETATGTPRIPWLSAVDGTETGLSARYFERNLCEPVRFQDAAQRLAALKLDAVIELSPHPQLLAALQELPELASRALLPSMRRQMASRRVLLQSVGTLWTRGHEVQLAPLVRRQPVVPLPAYPWERQRHWHESFGKGYARAPAAQHDYLSEPFDTAQPEGHRYASGKISAGAGALFAAHRVLGVATLPAAAMIESLLHCVDGSAELHDVRFERAISLSTEAVSVQVHLGPGSEDGRRCATLSFRDVGGEWATAATAETRPPAPSRDEPLDVEDLQAALAAGENTDYLYEGFAQRGLEYGEPFRKLERVARLGHAAVGQLRKQEGEERAGFVVHPAALDSAFHLVGELLSELILPGQPLLPARVHTVRWPGNAQDGPRPAGYASARLQHPEEARTDTVIADVALLDEQGRELLGLQGLELRALAVRQKPRPEWFLQTRWQALTENAVSAAVRATLRPFVVLAEDEAGGAAVVEQLQRLGAEARSQPLHGTLPAKDAATYVLLANGSGAATAELDLVQRAIQLSQELVPAQGSALRFVTQQTQAVLDEEPGRAHGAALWGVGRTLRLECPEFDVACWDTFPMSPAQLAQALLHQPAEDQLALRPTAAGTWQLFGARLQPAPRQPLGEPRIDGTVLVTGGLGALGLRAARVVAECGAQRVVLWSRRSPNEGAQRAITELRDRGVDVVQQMVDVADADQVAHAVQELRQGPPIRWVLHAAGVVDNAFLAEQTPDRVAAALRPKIPGAVNLAAALEGLPLRGVIYYASIAGAMGSPGQLNYAAGNAWLESFAREQSERGVPSIAIAWSGWAEAGLAAEAATWSERIAGVGFVPMASEAGDEVLRRFLADPIAGLAVVPLNRARLARAVGTRVPSLLRDLLAARGAGAVGKSETVLPKGLSAAQLEEWLTVHLTRLIATAVGRRPQTLPLDDALADLGVDSMLSLELRAAVERTVGVTLPAQLLSKNPSTRDVITHLLGQLCSNDASAPQERQAASQVSAAPTPAAEQNGAPRLYCFAHAGGTGAGYARIQGHFRGVDVQPVELPGRGRSVGASFATDLHSVVDTLCTQMRQGPASPAFLGHSLGAVLAYECARRLESAGHSVRHLVVAACKAPHLERAPLPSIATDGALLDTLKRWGGIPELLDQHPDVRALLLRRVRADLEMLERYRHEPGRRLTCPVTVLSGKDDASVPQAALEAWRELTSGNVTFAQFDGGHFFLHTNAPAIGALLRRALIETGAP